MNDSSRKRVLITGLTGQDGYYLAQLLARQGARVQAGVRETSLDHAAEIARELGVEELHPCELEDADCVDLMIARSRPQVVYHLAAQSSAGISWREPTLTAQVNAMGTLNLLEAIRRRCPDAAMVMAGTCDCYDHEAAWETGLTPETPFRATNPYAITKLMATQLIQAYRRQYGMRLSVAILFNHTSPRRPELFVERGIVRNAVRVKLGLAEAVSIGSMETRRDWAWAPEVMEGFAKLGFLDEPSDMVLASGKARTVADWVRETFAQLGLDLDKHLRIDAGRLHPGDRPHTFGNIEAARVKLGWTPTVDLADMVRRLIAHDMTELSAAPGVHD